MSLEDTIRGLTDAVNALNATLQSARIPEPAPQEVLPILKLRPKVEAPKPLTKPEEPSTTVAEPSPAPATTIPTAGSSDEVTYDMVAKAITDTFPKDRAKVMAALAKFGAAKGPQLKVEDYAAFLAELA
jgi:hypothetical protein